MSKNGRSSMLKALYVGEQNFTGGQSSAVISGKDKFSELLLIRVSPAFFPENGSQLGDKKIS